MYLFPAMFRFFLIYIVFTIQLSYLHAQYNNFYKELQKVYSFVTIDSLVYPVSKESVSFTSLYNDWNTYLLSPDNEFNKKQFKDNLTYYTDSLQLASDSANQLLHIFALQFKIRFLLNSNSLIKAMQTAKIFSAEVNKLVPYCPSVNNEVYYFIYSLHRYFYMYSKERLSVFNKEDYRANKQCVMDNLSWCSCSDNILVKTEALYFLTKIYAEMELQPGLAVAYSQKLVEVFPENLMYQLLYYKSLRQNNTDMPSLILTQNKTEQYINRNKRISKHQKEHLLDVLFDTTD